MLLNGALYGTTSQGGSSGCGVLFTVATNPLVLFPQLSDTRFVLTIQNVSGVSYTVQQSANLSAFNWTTYTNFIGNGSLTQFAIPFTDPAQLFFRVRQP